MRPTLREAIFETGQACIVDALKRHKTVKGAARELGINRTHMYRLCDRFGIRLPRERRILRLKAGKGRGSLLWLHRSKRARP